MIQKLMIVIDNSWYIKRKLSRPNEYIYMYLYELGTKISIFSINKEHVKPLDLMHHACFKIFSKIKLKYNKQGP